MTTNVYVFNQYFLSFVKSIKKSAKAIKEKSSVAREILKNINLHYNTFDNQSNDYVELFNKNFNDDTLDQLLSIDVSEDTSSLTSWIETNNDKILIKNTTLKSITKISKKKEALQQFLLIFYLFRDSELSELEIKNIMEKLKGINASDEIPERHQAKVELICQLNLKNNTGFSMKDIEDTTIGKLAKDIIGELDLDKMKNSIKQDGDLLGALGDPENGIGNLISDVSQKMANKLKNGEVKQDALLKDALSMAGKLPGLSGANTGSDESGSTPDIGNIMKMMSSMMGGNMNVPNGKMKNLKKKMDQQTRMKNKLNKKKEDTNTDDDLSKKGLEELAKKMADINL